MNKKQIIIFFEGDTEEEFYKNLVKTIRIYNGGALECKVTPINVKGIGNFKNQLMGLYENRISPNYEEYDYIVFLCYDLDVFKYSCNPPVNMHEVKNELLSHGAKMVYLVAAQDSIEDWLLKDASGVLKYLRLSKSQKIPNGNGVDKLKKLFKIANKVYIKGRKSNGFVDSLEIPVIMQSICDEIAPLCKELGLDCSKSKKCCSMK